MPHYNLRYEATDLELIAAEFVVGRAPPCDLVLDDALVSRRHAVFRRDASSISVEDLGSRNGIYVNGQKIGRATPLKHLDQVGIGSQVLVVIESADRPAHDRSPTVECPAPAEMLTGFETDSPDAVTREANAFELMTAIADKAIALGRFDEAERIAGSHLQTVLARAEQGDARTQELELATRYALLLAAGTGSGRWIDLVFRAHTGAGVLLSAPLIEQLHEVVRKIHYTDARAMRSYVELLRARHAELTSAQRFLLKRLEGLEAVVAG